MSQTKPDGTYKSGNQIQLLSEAGEYFAILEQMIRDAKHSIHLQTYIFQHDETGIRVSEWLMSAAERGVKVYLFVDGYASQSLPNQFVEKIRKSGINFSFFEPILKSKRFYVGRRMHHKIIVVDGECALIGGINIADRYNKIPGEHSWKNLDLFIQGETAFDLEKVCCRIWNKNTHRVQVQPSGPKSVASNGTSLRVRKNDWVMGNNEISKSYMEMFHKAQQEIIIVCSYFIPGRTFRRLMRQATLRGVKIHVVVAGPSDVMTAKYAERYLYDWMLRNKIRIYEYQNDVLHAKASQRDGEWMTIGSYNLNDLSAHASLEANVDIQGKAFVAYARQVMIGIIENECVEITQDRKWNIFTRFGHWAWYQIFRMLLFLFTFYFRKEKE